LLFIFAVNECHTLITCLCVFFVLFFSLVSNSR